MFDIIRVCLLNATTVRLVIGKSVYIQFVYVRNSIDAFTIELTLEIVAYIRGVDEVLVVSFLQQLMCDDRREIPISNFNREIKGRMKHTFF